MPLGKENVLREDQRIQPKGPVSFSVPLCQRPHFLEAYSMLLLGERMKGFTGSGSLPRTHCIRQPRTFTPVPGPTGNVEGLFGVPGEGAVIAQ